MIPQPNMFLRIVVRFCLHAVPGIVLLSALGSIAGFAFAAADSTIAAPENSQTKQPVANERDQRPPRRIPPRAAIEACKGKQEGDSCSFSSQQGKQDGECMSGVENVFACRPHRGAQPPETTPSTETTRNPNVQGEPVPTRQSVNPGTQTGKEPPVDHPQTVTSPRTETPPIPPPPPPPLTGYYDKLEEYAGNPGSCLVVALIASGLTWYGFFRYSTVPLRRLRKVTHQLAGGDLSARVGEGLVHRKDEVADLARDVDRMAERIESLVGSHQRLIRDVSHELRSPLARLNVALELARQSAGPAHSAPFDRIERESDRLNELIGQLLMLTRLESDSGMNQRGDLDIAALIMKVAQDVDFEARSNDRKVMATASEPMMLNGNEELLRQALENLVRNAARYTEAGTDVEISLRRKESGGRSWAHIEVRDHGPGVPESVLYDIFRPFYRVSDSRERQSGGTGVGLAISDRAVRLHGGSLRAFNAPGGGLNMEMELPLA